MQNTMFQIVILSVLVGSALTAQGMMLIWA